MLKNLALILLAIPLVPIGIAMNAFLIWASIGCSMYGLEHIFRNLGLSTESSYTLSIMVLVFVHIIVAWGFAYNIRHKDRPFESMQKTPIGLVVYLFIAAALSFLTASLFFGMTSSSNEYIPKVARQEYLALGTAGLVWLCAVFLGFTKVATEFFGEKSEA